MDEMVFFFFFFLKRQKFKIQENDSEHLSS